MRLKSRDQFPPGSFQFCQPETGWCAPTWRSFDTVVRELIAHRNGNPHLIAKHGWATDYDTVANEVDEYNAVRCRNAGYFDFILQDSPPSPKLFLSRFQARKPAAAVAGNIKRVAAGIGVLYDWLGSGATPVSKDEAERRAAICVSCPKNDGGDWKAYFTESIAEKIRQQLSIKHDLKLETSQDDKLTVCSGCDCPLHLKVWTPMQHVLAHTSDEIKQRLDPRCWVLQ